MNEIRKYVQLIESASKVINLPLITIEDPIYHVGTMDINNRSTGESHEGKALSVSTEPNAWRKINRGFTKGDTYLLEKPSHNFVSMHDISQEQWELIKKWGIDNGYFDSRVIYQYCWEDEEIGEILCFEFTTWEEAALEAESNNEDNLSDVISIEEKGVIPTNKFKNATGTINHKDLIFGIYCIEMKLNVDGLWWDDKLDEYAFSAPRGAIFDGMVSTWNITKLD